MNYILIVMWFGSSATFGGISQTSLAVEFKTLHACQMAAAEIKKQNARRDQSLHTILCAAKGEK